MVLTQCGSRAVLRETMTLIMVATSALHVKVRVNGRSNHDPLACGVLCPPSSCFVSLISHVHTHVHIPLDVHVHIDVHVGVTFLLIFLKKTKSRTLIFHDVCFSKPLTFHDGFMCLLLVAVSSTFSDFKPNSMSKRSKP